MEKEQTSKQGRSLLKKITSFLPAILLIADAVVLVMGILLMIEGKYNYDKMHVGLVFVIVSLIVGFVPYVHFFGLFDGDVWLEDSPRGQPTTIGAIVTIMSKLKISSLTDKELQMYNDLLCKEIANTQCERTYRLSKELRQETEQNEEDI